RQDADKVMKDARTVAEGARVIVEDVRHVVGANEPGGKERGIKHAVENLEGALAKLDDTLESTRSITQKIDKGEGTIGKLINDDKLINSVNELVDETGGFVKQVTRLQTIVGIRSEFYLAQGALKNYVGVKLQPKKDKYYLFEVVDDPRGRTTFVQKVTQTSDSSEDPVIREQQTITEDRFRLSLQFAKRFFFFTGRIGIIEGTGGLGADLHFLDDNLQISSDIFAFDENVNPRIKIWANYTFFNHLYAAAGVDEIWNDELTDFFVGVGLQFNDEDLKAILTTAPSI
ncbi:MCE family protein, partial [Myxococcota bacterium]|nr:MCE family protein [Myxococcota bacterium]